MRWPLSLLLLIVPNLPSIGALTPLQQIKRDFAALRMKSTTRHLMRPLTPRGREETLAIKQKVRNIARNGTFVVDAFADAARRYSVDEDTGGTGGLLGELLPQGAVRSKELDRCCFTAPLGSVHGPVETEYGWHLVLVCERIGCRYDEGMTAVVAVPSDSGQGVQSVLVSAREVEEADQETEVGRGGGGGGGRDRGKLGTTRMASARLLEKQGKKKFSDTPLGLILFWSGVVVAGGVLSEVLAALGGQLGM